VPVGEAAVTANERQKRRRRELLRRGLCVDCGMEPRARLLRGVRRYECGKTYTPSTRQHVLGARCLAARRQRWQDQWKLRRHRVFEPAVSKEQANREFLALVEA
jgi:hypothetical protein